MGIAASQRSSVVPKYYQLEQALRARIARLKPGAALPAEIELGLEYGLSRTTVRLAVDVLVAEGLLQRMQGKGTYVAASKAEFPLGRWRLPGAPAETYRVMDNRRTQAGEEIGDLFGIRPTVEVLRVRRLCYHGHVPMRVSELVASPAIISLVEHADFSRTLFYETLIEHGVEVAKHRLVVEASILEAGVAAELGVRAGLPSINVTRLVLAPAGRVVASIHLVTRGDIGRYVLELPEDRAIGSAAPNGEAERKSPVRP